MKVPLRLFLLVLCLWPGFLPVLATPVPVSEYALKAALLIKLPRFIYFPDKKETDAIRLCLLGDNPFGNTLERLAQPSEGGPNLHIMQLQTEEQASSCDLVFIAQNATESLDETLQQLGQYPLVTVSDTKWFARHGGMVEFALKNDGSGLNILINLRAAERQNIRFNAQLLRLARIVES